MKRAGVRFAQPRGHRVDAGQVGAGIVLVTAVALELGQPAVDLALEETVEPPEVGEAGGIDVDVTERDDRVDHCQAHAVGRRGSVANGAAANSTVGSKPSTASMSRRRHHP